jgi:hypothetical protein
LLSIEIGVRDYGRNGREPPTGEGRDCRGEVAACEPVQEKKPKKGTNRGCHHLSARCLQSAADPRHVMDDIGRQTVAQIRRARDAKAVQKLTSIAKSVRHRRGREAARILEMSLVH